MSQRILLLPGFAETETVFRNLKPLLPDTEVQYLDYRPVKDNFSLRKFSLEAFIPALIQHYKITGEDILIGHSMGGFFSHNIRQETGSEAILIASFTDPDKVVRMTNSIRFTKNFLRLGGMHLKPYQKFILKFRKDRPSHEELKNLLKEAKSYYTNTGLAKIASLSFAQPLKNEVGPSLRIHSKADRIVRPPAEEYHEVPGDHFNLVFHPEEVVKPIRDLLNY